MSLTREVIGGAGIISLAGIAARLLSFLAVPLLSRLLGPGPYGVAALVGTVVSLGSMLALLGVDMAYARYYLQEAPDQRGAVERFCWRFASIGALVGASIVGAGWWLMGQRWAPEEHRAIALYSALGIALSVAIVMATTRVRLSGNYRKVATGVIVSAAVSVGINITVAVAWRADVWALLLGVAGGAMATVGVLGLPERSTFLRRSHLSTDTRRGVLGLGLAGSVTAPMYWVISSSDRWFLAEYTSDVAVGIYSMAVSFGLVGLILNSSLTLTWFPEASRLYAQGSAAALSPLGRLWERLVVGLALVWMSVSASGGDVLRLLSAPEFHGGAEYIPWLAGGVFFYGVASLANTTFFLRGRMGTVAWFWLAGAAVSLALNTWLVPRLGAEAAAVIQCVSYAFIAIAVLSASRRMLRMPVQWWRLGLCLMIALGGGVAMSSGWGGSPLVSLVAKLPTAVLVGALVVLIIAPEWFRRALGAVRMVGGPDRR